MGKVIDLKQRRISRKTDDTGPTFEFSLYRFDADSVGFVEGEDPVVILTHPYTKCGINMSPEDALRLARALQSTAARFIGGAADE